MDGLTDSAKVDPGKSAAPGQALRSAAHVTAGAGIAHALLFLLSFWLLFDTSAARADNALSEDVYLRRLTLAGLYLMPFAGIAFIWFIVALRVWASGQIQRENVLQTTMQLVSGIVYVALFFVAGAAVATSAVSAGGEGATSDTGLTHQFPNYASTIIFVFAVRMAAMFVFTTSNIARSMNLLPRWFIFSGFGVGLFLLLSATFSKALVLVFPIWVLLLCTLLLVRARKIPGEISEVQGGIARRSAVES